MSFVSLGVPAPVAERLGRRGITEPFPIQIATIPDALAGRDVSGRAPTGSGKTVAFGIPLVTRLGRARPRHPRGLVLVPTRELAAQVSKELLLLAGPKGASVTTVYGGVGFGGQIKAMRRGTDIVVACPGRLADLLERGELFLDEVELVVIDEADRMADMGFLPEVRRLLDRVRPDRQTLLFSATLDGAVDALVTRYQRQPVRHELSAETDAPQSRHVFWKAERPQRIQLTARIIGSQWPAMVFCRTKHGADRLARQLTREGVSAAAIHGDRSQGQRDRALAAFSSGKVQALVATDIAARGIHVDAVGCVVHFDPPGGEKDYVHRSGRTGRAGAAGLIVSLVSPEQDAAVRGMQRKLGLPVGLEAPDLAALSDERRAAPLRVPNEAPGSTTRPSQRSKRRRRPAGVSSRAGGPGRRPKASRTR
jgi:superfamily II DNA/RNA helicase